MPISLTCSTTKSDNRVSYIIQLDKYGTKFVVINCWFECTNIDGGLNIFNITLNVPSESITCILIKPLHKHSIVSVHFNHFYSAVGICDTLSRHLSILTYIYLNVHECWLTSFLPQQRFNSKFIVIKLYPQKMCFPKMLCLALTRLKWTGSLWLTSTHVIAGSLNT